MHKRANKLRDDIGSSQWTNDAEGTIEEKVYKERHEGQD
jgi:hypothetical protein